MFNNIPKELWNVVNDRLKVEITRRFFFSLSLSLFSALVRTFVG
jgi:hypothetical protein